MEDTEASEICKEFGGATPIDFNGESAAEAHNSSKMGGSTSFFRGGGNQVRKDL